MEKKTYVEQKKRSILEEIINSLSLSDRYLVQQYLEDKDKMNMEDRERIRELEVAMYLEEESWWKSEYPQERAYRQFFCPTLIMNFDIYKQDMQKLLRREVKCAELFNRERLIGEVVNRYRMWRLTLKN